MGLVIAKRPFADSSVVNRKNALAETSKTEPLDPTLAPYGWMLLGCLSFTFMGRWTNDLHLACTWQIPALVRSALAFLFSAFLAYLGGARLVFWRPRILWLRSLAGSGSLICTFYAMSRMPLAELLTLTNTFPIWIALLSWPLHGQRPTIPVWLSLLGGVLGVALIKKPSFDQGLEAVPLALGASFFTAVAMMGLNRIRGIDQRAIVAHFSGVAVLFCLLAYFFLPHDQIAAPIAWHLIALTLLAVGISATAGQLCLTRAFSTGDPTTVSLVGLSQVVFAFVLDVRVWRGEMEGLTVAGILLIVLPTAWVILTRRPAPAQEANSQVIAVEEPVT